MGNCLGKLTNRKQEANEDYHEMATPQATENNKKSSLSDNQNTKDLNEIDAASKSELPAETELTVPEEKSGKNEVTKGTFVKRSHDSISRRFEIIKTLGEGGYGKVYLVRDKRANIVRAMKEVPKSASDLEANEKIIEEVEILKELVIFI